VKKHDGTIKTGV